MRMWVTKGELVHNDTKHSKSKSIPLMMIIELLAADRCKASIATPVMDRKGKLIVHFLAPGEASVFNLRRNALTASNRDLDLHVACRRNTYA